ncbi:MAG: hypothetical protein H7X93_03875 [Sphingomonadaceae bacterium]|nr:hypothetical protein [Sphingomonadaceae bacterium]
MMLRSLTLTALAATLAATLAPVPAIAQRNENVLVIYGDDACPTSNGEEIVVCARLPEAERYRIPEQLRDTSDLSANESWRSRAQALEYVGRTGINSCTPVGPGGVSGCQAELMRAARAERGGGALIDF